MYKILKSFKGSQNGTVNTDFAAGETVELSDYLVSCVDHKWIERVIEKEQTIENKAIITDGKSKKRKAK